jgi:elongation factor P
MIDTSDFKRGVCFQFKGAPMQIQHVTFSTPTARGGNTIAKAKLRNLLTGQVLQESIRSGEKFEEVDLEKHDASYMYCDGTNWHFMDNESFETFEFSGDDLGDITGYLKDGQEGLLALLIDGHIVSVSLPMTVDLAVTETDPVVKGATAKAQLKAATLETGMTVQVPAYLTIGEVARIDTRDGHFVERVKQ